MPTVLAASTIRVPAGAVILWPSMVRLTSGTDSHLADSALVAQDVVLVLVAEVAQSGVDDPAAGVAEAAQTPAVLQPVGDALQDVELDLRALVGKDALVGAHRPVLADAAGRALAARLVGVELEQAVGRFDDAVRVVHDDHAARPAHGARRGKGFRVGGG